MGFRFRKSLKILPGIRVNFSKSGISTSIGGPGATVNLGPRGTRKTIGIPGSGLSFSSFSSRRSAGEGEAEGAGTAQASGRNAGCGCLILIGVILLLVSRCVGTGQDSNSPAQPPVDASTQQGSPASEPSRLIVPDSTVYVTAATLNGRAAPSITSPIKARLHRDQPLRVIERDGAWLKVAEGAALFWILSDHVSSTQPIQSLRSPTAPVKAIARPRQHTSYGSCPCGSGRVCVGPRGGRYCITSGGNKRYGV